MASGEFEDKVGYEVGRGGVILPKLEIMDGNFYPRDVAEFLDELWRMNEVGGDGIGQPSTDRRTGYFVVPATQDKPAIFAFRETTKRAGQHESPVTTYQFLTLPAETGKFQPVMAFTHLSAMNSGFAGGRDTLVLQDHEGQETSLGLYGHRWHGEYEPDEFANYRAWGNYTYDSPESQQSLRVLASKIGELKSLLS